MKQMITKLCVVATVATTLFASCQQESDEILGHINGLNYGKDDNMSYTEMWDVLWKGYNQNYVGWETETIDWDEVNAITRPQLVALDAKLDTLASQGKLSPDSTAGKAIATEVLELFHSAFDSLHDGHTCLKYKDRYTKENLQIYPNELRLSQRKDCTPEEINFTPSYKYYFASQEDTPDDISIFDGNEMARNILTDTILRQMQRDADRLVPTSQEETEYKERLEECINLILSIDTASKDSTSVFAETFNECVFKNTDFADIKRNYNLYQLNFDFAKMQMFFTKDNIAYFWLSSFLNWPGQVNMSGDNSNVYETINKAFYTMITKWHDKVYQLHKEGKLKGVILDVRGNRGGNTDNLKNFAGLLFKGDKFQIGTCKRKNGTGRLDYAVPTPFYLPCLGTNSEDITEPIAILTNIMTASCAEFTTAAVKLHDNGVSIGTRTYGAGATLWNDGKNYTKFNYSGTIGIEGQTAVYAFIPMCVTYYDGGIGNIEGKGIAPDIEVPFDHTLYNETRRDSQFERALEYIRTGK